MIKINGEAESIGKSRMEFERNLQRQRDKMDHLELLEMPTCLLQNKMLPCKASTALLAHLNISLKYSSLVLLLTVICSQKSISS